MPYELDLFDDTVNFRAQFKELFSRIAALGAFTSDYVRRIVQQEEAFNQRLEEAEKRHNDGDDDDDNSSFDEQPTTFLSDDSLQMVVRHLYDAWSRAFVTEMESMREVRHYSFAGGGGGAKLKSCNGMPIFLELTRLHYFSYYPRLLKEENNLAVYEAEDLATEHYLRLHSLARTRDRSWVAIKDSFDISALYEEKEDPDEEVEEMLKSIRKMWEKPIMLYSQSEVQILIMFLTQQLNDIPTFKKNTIEEEGEGSGGSVVVEEYRQVFVVLWLRVAQFFNEFQSVNVLDDPDMRLGPLETGDAYSCTFNQRFLGFCFFYMGELLRRFFYYDLLVQNTLQQQNLPPHATIELLGERVKEWCTKILASFADDAFEDLYADNMPKGYAFAGDDGWFRFSRTGVHSRGACIAELRPHLHKRFFSEEQVSRRSVINTTRDSYVSRLFVLRAIDEFLKIQISRLRWMNAVVVMNDGIEMSAYKLQTNLAPVLLQVFSSFWPYDQGRVYVCDDIYQAVGVWFWLLATRYNGMLYDCDLSEFVSQIVPPPPLEEQAAQPTNNSSENSTLSKPFDLENFEI